MGAMQPYAEPKDGFTGTGVGNVFNPKAPSSAHNVEYGSALQIYPLGTKVRYYNDRLAGFGTCIYLRYSVGSETRAAAMICQPDPALTSLYYVTADASDFVAICVSMPQAITLSEMTTTYCGWFWCGGVCPDFNTAADTPFSDSTCASDNSLTAGEGFQSDHATDGHFESFDTNSVHTQQGFAQAGYCIADDGGTTPKMSTLMMLDFWP